MSEKQQEMIELLNGMYCSQSKEYQERYRKNYFALMEYIMNEYDVTCLPPRFLPLTGGVVPEVDEQIPVANINDMSRQLLEKALEGNHGNRKQAAQELRISDRTMYRRMKQFGLIP